MKTILTVALFVFVVLLLLGAAVPQQGQAATYKVSGYIYRYDDNSTVDTAYVILKCKPDSMTTSSWSGSGGGYACQFTDTCHNGHRMLLTARKTINQKLYWGGIAYDANSGSDIKDVYIDSSFYQVSVDLTSTMEPMQFSGAEPATGYGDIFFLPDGEPTLANEVYIEMSFDPGFVLCNSLEPLPPFNILFESWIDNNAGIAVYHAGSPAFVNLGDYNNPTHLFQATWQANVNKAPMTKTYVTSHSGYANTPDGFADLGLAQTQFLIGPTPDVRIGMGLNQYPVVVAPGGHFVYTGNLWNTSPVVQIVDVWTMVFVPGYGLFGPLLRMDNIMMSPHAYFTVPTVNQNVPTYAPHGVYSYIANCGDYPSNIMDAYSFPFTVGAKSSEYTADNWYLTNWFEKGTPEDITGNIPAETVLWDNYPNPFNAQTTITYELPMADNVKLEVYNLLGQKVITLVNERVEAGHHSVTWDASQYSSGIYFFRLVAGEKVFTKRMTLLK